MEIFAKMGRAEHHAFVNAGGKVHETYQRSDIPVTLTR
jgi:hypothetical protein